MEKNNFEGFFPFVIIILIYLITNLRNRKKKQEEEEQRRKRRPVPTPQPTFKLHPPPAEPKEISVIKKVEEEKPLPNQIPALKQTRIQNVVSRLHSKKDLIIASEILRKKDDCF